MASLIGRSPKDSFKELLTLNNPNGLSGTPVAIGDGKGNMSPLALSTTRISLNGDIWPQLNGGTHTVLRKSTTSNQLEWVTLSTSDIMEGSNLYYTQSRFDTSLGTKSTSNIIEGSNLYYTISRFESALAKKTTSELVEGGNLYYTLTRFNAAFSAKTTTNLVEGTNQYFTQSRFDSSFNAKTTSNLSEGTNQYFTTTKARNSFSGIGSIAVNQSTGEISYTGNAGGQSNTDFVANSLTVSGNILPTTNSTQDIGSPTMRFKSIYVDEAKLSVNTLYLGDTAILGTSADTINIKSDINQSINIQTSGIGSTQISSVSQVKISTSGLNADVLIQASGSGSKTRLGSLTAIEITAPITSTSSDLLVGGNQTISGNLTVSGNLTLNGTTTTVNSTNVTTRDNIITVNYGQVGAGVTSGSAGIQVDRGDLADYQMVFDETDDMFKVGQIGQLQTIASQPWVSSTTTPIGHVGSGGVAHGTVTTTLDGFMSAADKVKLNNLVNVSSSSPVFTGVPTAPTPVTSSNDTTLATTAFVKAQGYAVSSSVTSVVGKVGEVTLLTSDIPENTNLYYTSARFDTALATKSTNNLVEGSNLYYTVARYDAAFATKSTNNLVEGSNLYYTVARFDSAFSSKSTSNLVEGANLYYTSARAAAASPVQSVAGRNGVISLAVGDVSGALAKAGGTMTGLLTLSADPEADLHGATKKYVDTSISNVVLTSGALQKQTIRCTTVGSLAVNPGTSRMYPPATLYLDSIFASVNIPATGADIKVDIHKNGISILSGQYLTIAQGDYKSATIINNTQVSVNDYLTIDIIQVGSSVTGSDMVVSIYYAS